jgi:serine/threonine protein kinase/formylglycine-generating enzyme required for sulfatase activity
MGPDIAQTPPRNRPSQTAPSQGAALGPDATQVAPQASAPRTAPRPAAAALPDEGATLGPGATQAAPGATHGAHPHHPPGADRIGPYRIITLLGEGGMGQVFKAEQLEPVRRQVALKVIRLGMDSREVVARFAAERQALAMMDHPSVAKVYDAGVTDRGQPYFAMELVAGVPLTQYCDENRLTTRQRLELFVEICHAVQHAHQKGIIHRDLKPGNILVTTVDGKPAPKVIDFGIAKATGETGDQSSLVTRSGMMMGTLAYMSPEQAAGSLDIDTRTDVYSLGVVLYEMLTGKLPIDPLALREAGFEGAVQLIRGSDPAKPSTKIGWSKTRNVTVIQARTELAGLRRADPRTLFRQVSGDLDWITLKAVEKDRTRRYETASGLAADVLRHLNDEPVSARPPTLSYRVGKLAKKHKAGVAGAAAVAAALVFGLAGTTYGFVRASHERDHVVAAQQAEIKERNRAEQAEHERKLQQVDALLTASPEEVPALVASLKALPDLVVPPLRKWFDDPATPEGRRLRAACGMSAAAPPSEELTDYLIAQVPTAPAAESANVIDALRPAGQTAIEKVFKRMSASFYSPDAFIRDAASLSRYTVTLLSLHSSRGVDIMLQQREDVFARTTFIGMFASWHGDIRGALDYARTTQNADSRSGLCAALGTIDPATLSTADRQAVADVLSDLYSHAPDAATHSAAGWALRKWGEALPEIPRSNRPAPGRNWFVNSVGMTFLKPPSFVWYPDPAVYPPKEPNQRYGQKLPEFWICDCETSINAFDAFAKDTTVPKAERLSNWPGPDTTIGPTGDCPVQRTCMMDTMLFSNWLSKHEGRKPFYDMSNNKISLRLTDGYRLPSGSEWECACRAGTQTAFPWGSDVRWLNDYVVIGQDRDLPCGSKLPNSWGLFDMLGNSWELTFERYVTPQTFEALGQPPNGTTGAMRGGSYDGGTAYTRPGVVFPEPLDRRAESVGFRLVFSEPAAQVQTNRPVKQGG